MSAQELGEIRKVTMAGYYYLLLRCAGFPHPVALSHGRASPIDEQFSRRVTALFDRLTGADRETSSGDHHVAIVLPGRPETVETSVAS